MSAYGKRGGEGPTAVAALALLFFAPAFLLLYGWPLAWAWASVLISWVFVDCLHGYFEDQQDAATPARRRLPGWREVSRVVTTYEHGPNGRLRRVRRAPWPGDRA